MKNLLNTINNVELNPADLYGLIQETDFEFAVKIVVLAELETLLENTKYQGLDICKLYALHKNMFEQRAIQSFKAEYK